MKKTTAFGYEVWTTKVKRRKVSMLVLVAVGIALGWLYLILDTLFVVYQYNSTI